ncbi:MAG: hypothetical protein JW821_05815 [Deltaproteobacteria bacterium]|nr:hypothetical protein [Deltaproteobacteria bacterium]
MHIVFMLAIIFGGSVLLLAIIGSTILIGIKILKGGASPRGQRFQADEARIVQEIHQGLSRLEERIEALETIVMDRERKDRLS